MARFEPMYVLYTSAGTTIDGDGLNMVLRGEDVTAEIASLRAQLAAAEERGRILDVVEKQLGCTVTAENFADTMTFIETAHYEKGVMELDEKLAAAREDAVREFAAEYNQEVTARSADGFCRVRPLTEWADAWIVAERGGR